MVYMHSLLCPRLATCYENVRNSTYNGRSQDHIVSGVVGVCYVTEAALRASQWHVRMAGDCRPASLSSGLLQTFFLPCVQTNNTIVNKCGGVYAL